MLTVVRAGEPTLVDVEITNDGEFYPSLEYHVYICKSLSNVLKTARKNSCFLQTSIIF